MTMKIGYIMVYDLKMNLHLTERGLTDERRMDLPKMWQS